MFQATRNALSMMLLDMFSMSPASLDGGTIPSPRSKLMEDMLELDLILMESMLSVMDLRM